MFSYHPNRRDIGQGHCYAKGWLTYEGTPFSLARALTSVPTSPIIFKDGIRKKSNFLTAHWIALDFDDGRSIAEVYDAFEDITHVMATTKSHQISKGGRPPCDRFRLWLRLSRATLSSREYEATLRKYVDEWDSDPACVDAARLFWPGPSIISVASDGDTIDVVSPPEKTYAPIKAAYTGKIPYWVRDWLAGEIPSNVSWNRLVFKVACWLTVNNFSVDEIIYLVLESQWNKKADSPMTLSEVKKAVRSGHAHAMRELRSGSDRLGSGP